MAYGAGTAECNFPFFISRRGILCIGELDSEMYVELEDDWSSLSPQVEEVKIVAYRSFSERSGISFGFAKWIFAINKELRFDTNSSKD